MNKQKSCVAIHDVSGLGKCSLTAALPVLSAAGASVAVLPTAVLSTQTGGLNDYTYTDLTAQMPEIIAHWRRLGVDFDAFYSGFLGSEEQIDIVAGFVSDFKRQGSIFLCDPAMADNGALYDVFDRNFALAMRRLCSMADIIVPNFTEAALLLGEEYLPPPYTKEYIENTLKRLSDSLGVPRVVLTGAALNADSVGAASYDASSSETEYSLLPRVEGMFHSTGDLFASSLLGAVLNGMSISDGCRAAIEFTHGAILRTVEAGGDSRFGLMFEPCLPEYMKRLGII